METEKSGIKIKTTSLAKYDLITKPGTYLLKVLSTVTEKNLVESEKTGRESFICSLAAIAEDKFPQVKEVFAGKEEVDIEDTQGLFMTANIWKNGEEQPALPMKNEVVKATIERVLARDSDELVLRVTGIQVMAPAKAEKLDITKFFASASSPAEAATAPVGETITQKQ